MGVSGSGDLFEVFDVLKFKKEGFLSKNYDFCFCSLFIELKTFTKKRITKHFLCVFFFEFSRILIDF